jgi:hypothetical protein
MESVITLLEKADDIEDLSPDPDTWEEIRLILYYGLTQSSVIKRYIRVHEVLHKLCLGNATAMTLQLWDLVWNLIESILFISKRRLLVKEEEDGLVLDTSKDYLCTAILQSILTVLCSTASDYIF